MWATQSSFAAGTTVANLNANTIVNRRSNAKAGKEHHTFLQTDYLTSTNWFGLQEQPAGGRRIRG
ncbi:hypothetical protein LP414_02225 [Polaromonas sp. P1(28)-13]|nr:hypothetical protein LP414_02225 [Polaromonas sp. P1(28)-13]